MNSLPGVSLWWKTVSDGWISQKRGNLLAWQFLWTDRTVNLTDSHNARRWWKKLFCLSSMLLTFARCPFFFKWLLLFFGYFLFFILILLIIRNCWDWLAARKQLFITAKQFMNAFIALLLHFVCELKCKPDVQYTPGRRQLFNCSPSISLLLLSWHYSINISWNTAPHFLVNSAWFLFSEMKYFDKQISFFFSVSPLSFNFYLTANKKCPFTFSFLGESFI